MEKTYIVIRKENKDIVYSLREGDNRLTFVLAFSSISGTYIGMEIRAFDDNWQYLKRNIHLLDIFHGEFEKEIQKLGFVQKKPTQLEIALADVI